MIGYILNAGFNWLNSNPCCVPFSKAILFCVVVFAVESAVLYTNLFVCDINGNNIASVYVTNLDVMSKPLLKYVFMFASE